MPINAGDAAWMLVASAFVFFMMPGLALFYGGLVGQKNVISSTTQSFVAIGVVSVLWVVVGYSLAFGPNHGGVVGAFSYVMLHGVGDAIGVVLTGVFASLVVNAAGVAGGWAQLGRQSLLGAMGLVYPFVMTFAILWITEKTVGLRVSPNEQAMGLDESDIGEKAYVPEINQEMTRCFQTT
jgi:ammonia channel protein AmtB